MVHYFIVNRAFSKESYQEVSESEFLDAKNIELDTYTLQGFSCCFNECSLLENLTDVFFSYLNPFEEGEFLFGFIVNCN